MTNMLTRKEMGSLNRALAKRTGGRISVGSKPISVSQGIDLWNATESFEAELSCDPMVNRSGQSGEALRLFSARDGVGFRRVLGTGAGLAAAASLAGCATFGTNVNGDFACRAPDGICAPTSKIDDEALAMISGESGMTPAGPYLYDSPSRGTVTAAREPVRSGEKVLRIVFPAHIDGSGRFREVTAIHAVVERGSWLEASNTLVAPRVAASSGDRRKAAQLAASSASGMPTLADIASSAPEMQFHDPVAAIDAQNAEQAALEAPIPVTAVNPGALTRKNDTTLLAGSQPDDMVSAAAPESIGKPAVHGVKRETAAIDPMAVIKAQVAGRLQPKKATARSMKRPVSKAAALSSSSEVADYSLPPGNGVSEDPQSAASVAAQLSPVNRPSLFPVSEVKP
jgi:conjugal transfer pilus assembly protein TraV